MAEGTEVASAITAAAADVAKPDTTAITAAAGTPDATKVAGDGTTEKVEDATGDKAKTGAPEAYAAFTVAEGLELDQPAIERFVPIAKDLNLTQEQAQKLVDFQSELVQQAATAEHEAWNTLLADWVKGAKADKEIGGAGFDAAVAHAGRAIKAFGTTELKAALDATGVGNHPEFIRVFARIGKAISEDKLHFGNADAGSEPKSLAERLFPNQGKPQGA